MDAQNTFLGTTLTSGKLRHFKMPWTLGVTITLLMFLSTSPKCQTEASFQTSISEMVPNEPIKIKMLAPTSVSKKHTRTRQNSRFLRTFPPMELLNLAKQSAMDNDIDPMMNFNDRRNSLVYDNPYPTMKARIDAGNSPIFYIKLPPVPYIFMPGVGYVSPHPYSSGSSMPLGAFGGGGSSMGGGGQGMMPGMGSFIPSGFGGQETSMEQPSQSVISLPLKFLSNGRPHQIESNKRKKRPGNKENSSENKGASLISGGKYSFNGRPTAVFVVRSPATRK